MRARVSFVGCFIRSQASHRAYDSEMCAGEMDYLIRVRRRCTPPALHQQRCGDALSRRPKPNTPHDLVDFQCWIPCHVCHGSVQALCGLCDGEGRIPVEDHFQDWVTLPEEDLRCVGCQGSGTVACTDCMGYGFIPRCTSEEARQAGWADGGSGL